MAARVSRAALFFAALPLAAAVPALSQEEPVPWERNYAIVTDHSRLRTNLPRAKAEEFARLVERLHDSFVEICATPLKLPEADERIEVFLLATRDEFRGYCRRHVPGAEEAPGLFDVQSGASYFWDRADEPGATTVREILLHECTHQLWWLYAGKPRRSSADRALFWLSEGFANWFESMDDEGAVHPRRSGRYARAIDRVRDGKFVPLGTFEGYDQDRIDCPDEEARRDRHAQAMALVDFFLSAEDGKRARALLKTALAVERGRGERALFRREFGAPLASFEEAWKAHVLAAPAEASDPDRTGLPSEDPPEEEVRIRPPHRTDEATWRQVAEGGFDGEILDPAGVDEEVALREAAGTGSRTLRTDHYLLVSDAEPERLAAIGAMCERWYAVFAEHFGVTVDATLLLRRMNMRRRVLGEPLQRNETMKVACFLAESRYDAFLARYCAGRMKGGAGFTDPATTASVVRRVPGGERSLDETLVHELAHLFVETAYGRAVQGAIPAWLSEGSATYFETLSPAGDGAGDVNRYRLEAVRASSLSVEKLLSVHPREAEASSHRFYAESWALYHFSRRGPEKWRKRFREFEDAAYQAYFHDPADSVTDGARMFHEAFGPDLSALEKDLKAYVRELQARE